MHHKLATQIISVSFLCVLRLHIWTALAHTIRWTGRPSFVLSTQHDQMWFKTSFYTLRCMAHTVIGWLMFDQRIQNKAPNRRQKNALDENGTRKMQTTWIRVFSERKPKFGQSRCVFVGFAGPNETESQGHACKHHFRLLSKQTLFMPFYWFDNVTKWCFKHLPCRTPYIYPPLTQHFCF